MIKIVPFLFLTMLGRACWQVKNAPNEVTYKSSIRWRGRRERGGVKKKREERGRREWEREQRDGRNTLKHLMKSSAFSSRKGARFPADAL